MNRAWLTERELKLIGDIFGRHPEVAGAILFGSRAKGTHTPRSDVDLALTGMITPLGAEAIAAELDELPIPYRFEVQPLESIRHLPLRDHIERVGVWIYRAA